MKKTIEKMIEIARLTDCNGSVDFIEKANNLIASLKNKAANINKRDSRDEIVEYEVPTKILSFKEEA